MVKMMARITVMPMPMSIHISFALHQLLRFSFSVLLKPHTKRMIKFTIGIIIKRSMIMNWPVVSGMVRGSTAGTGC